MKPKRPRMKLINTTTYPNHFLRRMVVWCCKEVGLTRPLREAKFRKKHNGLYRGLGGNGRIVVSINRDGKDYPHKASWCRAYTPVDGSDPIWLRDVMEALVYVTAHEIGHVSHFRKGFDGRGSEARADLKARYVLRKFRDDRAALEAAWSEPVARATKPKVSVVEKRAAKAAADLARWERKLKLAKTKVASYKRRVRYYDKKTSIAATNGGE